MDEVAAERVRALAGEALARVEEARAAIEDLLAAVARVRGGPADGRPAAEPAAPAIGVDAARLVAIEMAVAGRSRDEVERHLEASYGGPDTAAVLADVFGA